AEEEHALEAEAYELVDLADERVDREALEGRQPLVREWRRRDEQRHHQVVERDGGLADEITQLPRAAQAAQAGDGKGAHGLRVRGGSTSTSSTSTGTGRPCHGSKVMRSTKNSQIARPTASSGN